MSDDIEGSAAMLGSVANSPVAWMVADPSGRIEACRESFDEAAQLATDFTATEDGDVIYKVFAVYRQPQPTLTSVEREVLEWADGWARQFADGESRNPVQTYETQGRVALHNARSAALRGLLERLK